MTKKEIASMIGEMTTQYTYLQYPVNEAPDPPYICFYYPNDNDFFADGTNYQKITQLNIEYYSDSKDFDAEQTIESVLATYGLTYSKEEQYIDDEDMYETLYITEVNLDE